MKRPFPSKRCRGWLKKPAHSGPGALIQDISTRRQRWRFTNRCIDVKALALFLLPFGLLADDWPQFRGNPSLTGVASSPVPKTLKLLWTFDAGESIESSAAILDGVVYVGSESADLIAVSLADGKLLWKYKVKDGIGESSPAVHSGIVVIGDLSGTVHAVNAKDGKALWTFS